MTKLVARMATLGLGMLWVASAAFAEEEQVLIQYGPSSDQMGWMPLSEMNALSDENHEAGRCAGFFDLTETHAQWAAIDTTPRQFVPLTSEGAHSSADRDPRVVALVDQVDARLMFATINRLSQYHTRYAKTDTGVQAAHWIKAQFETLAQGRSDVEVQLIPHTRFKQPSVRARILGSGPHAHEVVVVGAHEDSTRSYDWGGGARAPGADDDASGVATVLETFRIIVQSGYRPDRTLEFFTYAAEEMGLLGSQDIALDYKNRKVAVVSALQFDMTMVPGASTEMNFVTDYTDPAFNQQLRELNDRYVRAPWSNTECGYGCSDHASWNRAGYPSAIPFESSFDELNNRIHSERDLPNSLNIDFGAHFARLGVAYVAEVGGIAQ